MCKKVIIGGGGTGGHIFPAISIANALKVHEPDIEILFVGAKGRIEMEKVPEAGFKIVGLPVSGFQRKLTIQNVKFIINLIISVFLSKEIIKKFNPSAALGVGGYASGPVIRAAARKGVPIILQEQNSYAGLTNRLLSKYAFRICVAYEGMEKYFPADKIILTGNPVRRDIIDCHTKREKGIQHFGLDPGKTTVLILGGSLGAKTINEAIENSLSELPRNIQLIWQTGKIFYFNKIHTIKVKIKKNVVVVPFLREMDLAFGCADIIVSRAGAGTISELAIIGKPVILIPSPNVTEDHQTKNAMALVDKNAAIIIKDNEAREKLVKTIVHLVKDIPLRNSLSENIKKFALPEAADRIAEEILKVAVTR